MERKRSSRRNNIIIKIYRGESVVWYVKISTPPFVPKFMSKKNKNHKQAIRSPEVKNAQTQRAK